MDYDPRWQLLREIFLAAAALNGDERSSYLSEHCPDPALRHDVERLLEDGALTESAVIDDDSHLSDGPKKGLEPLPAGAQLGHYRIRRKLGSGGMGWVYEATDDKLRRIVAIKVLSPGEISEHQRLRFAREAQSASALNHPNIVTVYETGREGDVDFIVMERVDGETLHQKIGARKVDLRSALRYAMQIADALGAAHEAGIVHRDLKPGNVMVTERGLVKVLDFGLAKRTRRLRAAAGGDGANMQASLSQVGLVVGTLAYMSPEQAEGKTVDTRSDIFSFGSVLFEMVTGRRAFEESGIATLAAIVQAEPRIAELPATLPRGFARILTKCFAKKPADRWQHICDVRLQLEDLLKDLESPPAEGQLSAPVRRPTRWPIVMAACLAGALLMAVLLRMMAGSKLAIPPEPLLRMLTADNGLSSFPALSKDGKLLAFASDRSKDGNLDIWLQQIGGRDPIRLTKDASDKTDPAFSPDGTRIAFRSEKDGGGIYVVPTLGGETPVLLAPGGRNPRFSPDGKWISYWTGREGALYPGSSRLFLVESGGGKPRPVHPEITPSLFPVWSPRGDELLVLGQFRDGADWYIVPVDPGGTIRKTGALAQIKAQGLSELQLALNVRPGPLDWIDEGHERVLFASAFGDVANLWEIDLGTDGLVHGAARRMTRGPGRQIRAAHATMAGSERVVFSDEELNFDIWTTGIDADSGVARGDAVRRTDEQSLEWAPSISWDGRWITYISRRGGTWLLRSRELAGGTESTVISSPDPIFNARLAGNGSRVLFSNSQYSIFSVPRSGGAVEKLCDGCGTLMGVSYDGLKITYEPRTNEDVLLLDGASGTTRKLALRQGEGVILSGGQLSRDEKWVAFHSLNSRIGGAQVWVAPVRADGPPAQSEWIAVTDGHTPDRDPSWSPSGNLVYFLSDRDGFRCIWARRLDSRTKQPSGDAFAVKHFHSARRRLGSIGYLTALSMGGDQMAFALGELTGNIWLAESVRSK